MTEVVDTVIVGAGLAGLSAAHTLTTNGQTVRVLEVEPEVGGRTRTGQLADGVLTEFGGEWVGPQHRHMQRLVNELGLHLQPAKQLGHPILWRGARRNLIRRIPALSMPEQWALLRACWRLNQLARTVDPVQPWLSAEADALDSHAFAAWLRAQGVDGDGLRYLSIVVGALMSADIEHVSLLHVLWWFARGRGLLRTLHTTFAYTVVEGAQSITARLAEQLGDRVTLNTAVRRISDADQVHVETIEGVAIQARHTVVTAPVGALAHLDFDPPLPETLAALDELRGQPGTKVTGLLPHEHHVRHRAAIGGTTVAAAWRANRRITGFAAPDYAEADEAILTADLAALFHITPENLRARTVYRWSEHPHIPACDIGFSPGQLRRHGPHLTRSHGHIHFAGAERSSWPNNMEGAVESGINAARTILSG
ncbi:monoamine oxidase [Halopolyspora algeriensis]|uniref:Monoamine oxidase n=1 Tax=Halopolyspora algeriensis TaxID=1500506 RepID=A0A368W2R2_9ACTN|nr:NAD(P)/FAD-dependent oxidoreductase [Halopolyspora algeriensis]RCW46973.1 monoamine oxidase [Halopolyspora algeriensis]TQM48063.1 monoamine oxidase [Halopolyspora algeriensis]